MNKNKFLNPLEAKHLEEVLMRNLKNSTRDCLLLLLALKTGARASEILGIKKEDLNHHQKSVFIRGLKGSNDRELPISPMVFNTLVKYSFTVQSDFIFPISYERMYQIWIQYRPCQKKLHSLRHSCALRIYEKSKNIHLVKSALGHKAIQTSMVYLDFFETQSQLRKAML